MQVKQPSIAREMDEWAANPKYGPTTSYDLNIKRVGHDKETTRYKVYADPPSPLSPEVQLEWDKIKDKADLNRLLTNGDPWGGTA